MFRLHDWSCSHCEGIHEEVIVYPQGDAPPKVVMLLCRNCNSVFSHNRLPSRPANYMPRAMAPMVTGGAFDTVGKKPLEPLPTLPDGATLSNARDFFNTKEFKEVREYREVQKQQNTMKARRAELIRKGYNIDMRTTRLPGDPVFD